MSPLPVQVRVTRIGFAAWVIWGGRTGGGLSPWRQLMLNVAWLILLLAVISLGGLTALARVPTATPYHRVGRLRFGSKVFLHRYWWNAAARVNWTRWACCTTRLADNNGEMLWSLDLTVEVSRLYLRWRVGWNR